MFTCHRSTNGHDGRRPPADICTCVLFSEHHTPKFHLWLLDTSIQPWQEGGEVVLGISCRGQSGVNVWRLKRFQMPGAVVAALLEAVDFGFRQETKEMQQVFGRVGVVIAALLGSAVLILGCESNPVPVKLHLGTFPGISKEELAYSVASYCSYACDGEIVPDDAPDAADARGYDFFDADLDGLLILLGVLSGNHPMIYGPFSEFLDQAGAWFEEFEESGLDVGAHADFGSRNGLIDLTEACAPGTGSLLVSYHLFYEGWEPPSSSVKAPEPGVLMRSVQTRRLTLRNCQISGALFGSMDEQNVTLSGNLLLVGDGQAKGLPYVGGLFYDFSMSGYMHINPLGVGAGTIWGNRAKLEIGGHTQDTSVYGEACYNGQSVEGVGSCVGGTSHHAYFFFQHFFGYGHL